MKFAPYALKARADMFAVKALIVLILSPLLGAMVAMQLSNISAKEDVLIGFSSGLNRPNVTRVETLHDGARDIGIAFGFVFGLMRVFRYRTEAHEALLLLELRERNSHG